MIRKAMLLLVFAVGSVAFSDQCYNYELPPGMDLDHAFLDKCETILVKRYIPESKAYEIEKFGDPTFVPIYTSPENLFDAISNLSMIVIRAAPGSMVDKKFYIDKAPLILLEDNELEKRKTKFAGKKH